MADAVQRLLEAMAPDLEALEAGGGAGGGFSRAELKEVVRRRRDFEYRLRRRRARKEDFLRYVEYELALEELRRLRKAEAKRHGGGRRDRGTPPAQAAALAKRAEHAIVRGVHFIFTRALQKFPGDLRLWQRYFDFCKAHKASKALSKALTRALQLHPTQPGLWVEAASWELNGRRNPEAARKLMQQGLRLCPRSETLWVEYFHLELVYARQLQVRQGVIGLDAPAGPAAQGNAAVREGAVGEVVFKRALAALGPSTALCRQFLAVVRGFEAGAFAPIEAAVLATMAAELGHDAGYWDFRARDLAAGGAGGAADGPVELQGVAGLARLGEARAVFAEAAAAAPGSVELTERRCAFLDECLDAAAGLARADGAEAGAEGAPAAADTDAAALEAFAEDVAGELAAAYAASVDAGVHSPRLVRGWVALLTQTGRRKAAAAAARRALGLYPGDPDVWEAGLAALAARRPTVAALRPAYLAALGALPPAALPRAVGAVLGVCCGEAGLGADWVVEPLVERLHAPLRAAEAAAVQGTLCLALLADGLLDLEVARGLYRRVLRLPGATAETFQTCIDVEHAAAAEALAAREAAAGRACPPAERRAEFQAVFKLYERALFHHGGSAELWANLCGAHAEVGDAAAYEHASWRALQALPDAAAAAFQGLVAEADIVVTAAASE